MTTQHRFLENCVKSSTGSRTVARKLNFEDECSNDSLPTSPREASHSTWRNVTNDFEYREQRETQMLYSYMSSKSPVARFEFSNPDLACISDCEDSLDKLDYTSSETSDSLGQDQELDLFDEEDNITCRKSAATTDITGSHPPPEENKDLSQNLQSLTDVMVNLNLTQYISATFVQNTETSFEESSEATAPKRMRLKQNYSKSETVANSFPGRRIKFRSPSNVNQCEASTSTPRKESTLCTKYFLPSDLAPIRHMLKTCQEIHPFDREPRKACPTPVDSPVKSLMDGGDAVDVRGLANRLAWMKSESKMKVALRQYMDTHVPSMQGCMDQIIESTVEKIAKVSLKDSEPRTDISALTSTTDWLKVQNGGRELTCNGNTSEQAISGVDKNLTSSTNMDLPNVTNGFTFGVFEVHSENVWDYRCDSTNLTPVSRNVDEVCCSRGNLLHSEYVSPEEYRFASYTGRKCKRKIQEVEGDTELSPERTRRKGKKKVAFALDTKGSKT